MQLNNRYGVRKYGSVGTEKQILFHHYNYDAIGINVAASASNFTDSNGRKWVLAGTPMTGNMQETERPTAWTVATAADDESNMVGVLQHDVDVTLGDNNGSIIFRGNINLDMIRPEVRDVHYGTGSLFFQHPRVCFLSSTAVYPFADR